MNDPITYFKDLLTDAGLWEQDLLVKRNQILVRPGTINTNLYFVVSGSLRAYVMDGEEENTIRFGYDGSFLLALDSFLSGKPTHYVMQAIKQSHLKVVPKQPLMDLMNSRVEYLTLWRMLMENLVYQQLEREIDLLTSSPAERYQRVLKRSPQLFQAIPNRYIASYLRMAPETLSRLKKS
jgi:CRP-like cAMP-binding protein